MSALKYPFWQSLVLALHESEAPPAVATAPVKRQAPPGDDRTAVAAVPRPDASLFLTTKEAARVVGINHRTLERRRLTADGPPYRKLGKSKKAPIRYYLPELIEWMNTNRHGSTSEYQR